jgi:hypothetical protein
MLAVAAAHNLMEAGVWAEQVVAVEAELLALRLLAELQIQVAVAVAVVILLLAQVAQAL